MCFIKGKRLFLRKLRLTDVTMEYVNWLKDSEVNRFLEARFQKWSLTKLRRSVQDIRRNKEYLFLGIFLNKTHKMIGTVKIGPINKFHKYSGLGIMIGEKSLWGQGYGSEVIKLATDFTYKKLKLHKLFAEICAENYGSLHAFIKSGYQKIGTRKKHLLVNGIYLDNAIFEKINYE